MAVRKERTSKRIKEILEIFNIKQVDFCRRTGLTKSTVSLYINGKREPMQDKIDLIARTFGLDPAWVMGYDVGMYRDEREDYTEMVVRSDDEAYVLCTMREMSQSQIERLISYADYLANYNEKRKNADSEEV